jgi:hypothetical protein
MLRIAVPPNRLRTRAAPARVHTKAHLLLQLCHLPLQVGDV